MLSDKSNYFAHFIPELCVNSKKKNIVEQYLFFFSVLIFSRYIKIDLFFKSAKLIS